MLPAFLFYFTTKRPGQFLLVKKDAESEHSLRKYDLTEKISLSLFISVFNIFHSSLSSILVYSLRNPNLILSQCNVQDHKRKTVDNLHHQPECKHNPSYISRCLHVVFKLIWNKTFKDLLGIKCDWIVHTSLVVNIHNELLRDVNILHSYVETFSVPVLLAQHISALIYLRLTLSCPLCFNSARHCVHVSRCLVRGKLVTFLSH